MKPRIWSRKAIYSRCISILDISGRYKISAVIFRGRRQAARRIDGQIAALRTAFIAAPKAERGGPKPRYGRPVETQKRLGRQLLHTERLRSQRGSDCFRSPSRVQSQTVPQPQRHRQQGAQAHAVPSLLPPSTLPLRLMNVDIGCASQRKSRLRPACIRVQGVSSFSQTSDVPPLVTGAPSEWFDTGNPKPQSRQQRFSHLHLRPCPSLKRLCLCGVILALFDLPEKAQYIARLHSIEVWPSSPDSADRFTPLP